MYTQNPSFVHEDVSNHSISLIDPLRLTFWSKLVPFAHFFLLIVDPVVGLVAAADIPPSSILWWYNTAIPSTRDSKAVTLELMREIAPAAIVATYINTRNARCFWGVGVIAEVPHFADLESVW